MKEFRWYITVSFSLLLVSAATYFLEIRLFNRNEDTFFYMLQDLAFVPIQVLLVTFFLNEFLRRRERNSMLRKLYMVIGVFFSEMGTELLQQLSDFDIDREETKRQLDISGNWTDRKFQETRHLLKKLRLEMYLQPDKLISLKLFMMEKRSHVLTMMENPNLLEHETFTDLLLAISHVADELSARADLKILPKADMEHIALDIRRAYSLLLLEWLSYMQHMKTDYPFLFSFAVRTNPFNPKASVIIQT